MYFVQFWVPVHFKTSGKVLILGDLALMVMGNKYLKLKGMSSWWKRLSIRELKTLSPATFDPAPVNGVAYTGTVTILSALL
jgi:hypothetical protein